MDVLQDLRGRFGLTRDQGDRPTCIAFAVTDTHGAARSGTTPLSTEHLYYHAIQRTPGRDPEGGVSLPTILAALEADGQCSESGWTYLKTLPSDIATWKPPASATPVFKRQALAKSTKVSKVIEELDSGSPVILTLLLGLRFYDPVNGVVSSGPNDIDTDYHALVAVGHGAVGAQSLVLVRNSWGKEWGTDGHAWIAADYLEPRLHGVATLSKVETT
jgi:hypothetical protein